MLNPQRQSSGGSTAVTGHLLKILTADHPSSATGAAVGVFGATAYFSGKATVYEDDNLDISRDFLEWDDGYAQTKWVAEKIILDARAQGIPVTVYRPGFITGDSHTGAMNANDFLYRLRQSRYCSPISTSQLGWPNLSPDPLVSHP